MCLCPVRCTCVCPQTHIITVGAAVCVWSSLEDPQKERKFEKRNSIKTSGFGETVLNKTKFALSGKEFCQLSLCHCIVTVKKKVFESCRRRHAPILLYLCRVVSRRKTKINNSDVLVGFVSPRSPRRGKSLSRVFDNSWRRCVRNSACIVKNTQNRSERWVISSRSRKSQPSWMIREFSKFEEKVSQTRVKLLIFTSVLQKKIIRN